MADDFTLTQFGVVTGLVLGFGVALVTYLTAADLALALALGFGLGAAFAVVFSAAQADD